MLQLELKRILLRMKRKLSKHAIELQPPPISCHHRCCILHHCPKLKVQQKSHHRLPINAYAVHCTAHADLPSQLASFPYIRGIPANISCTFRTINSKAAKAHYHLCRLPIAQQSSRSCQPTYTEFPSHTTGLPSQHQPYQHLRQF